MLWEYERYGIWQENRYARPTPSWPPGLSRRLSSARIWRVAKYGEWPGICPVTNTSGGTIGESGMQIDH